MKHSSYMYQWLHADVHMWVCLDYLAVAYCVWSIGYLFAHFCIDEYYMIRLLILFNMIFIILSYHIRIWKAPVLYDFLNDFILSRKCFMWNENEFLSQTHYCMWMCPITKERTLKSVICFHLREKGVDYYYYYIL